MGQKQTPYTLAAPAIDPMLPVPILPYSALLIIVIPVQVGMTNKGSLMRGGFRKVKGWIPAFAGMTGYLGKEKG
jgi:hypothetical protein